MSLVDRSRGKHLVVLPVLALLIVGLSGWLAPSTARAEGIVVAKFTGKAAKLAKHARVVLLRQLKEQGVTLVPIETYLKKAKRARLSAAKALTPAGIKKMCAAMEISGVVKGTAVKKRKQNLVTIQLINASGAVQIKKDFNVRGLKFPDESAQEMAALIAQEAGGGKPEAVAEAAPAAEEIPPPAAEAKPEAAAEGKSDEAFLPPWARTEAKAEGEGQAAESAPAAAVEEQAPEPAPTSSEQPSQGAVPDIIVVASGSGHMRAGLTPRHESGFFPGVRLDARAFLGSFLDTPFVRDIGIGGMFDMGMGLKYGLKDGDSDGWAASQMQWQAELNYRLAFLNDVFLAPAFVVRFGYGSTSCTIDTEDPVALSVGYSYPYAALDIHLMLVPPLLRLFVSGGYLFSVSASEDVTGSGSGFTLRGGLAADLFDTLHIQLGYEHFQFTGLTGPAGSVSDTFQSFFVGVGWNYQ